MLLIDILFCAEALDGISLVHHTGLLHFFSGDSVTSVSAPKKRKQAILSFGRFGQLQVLRNDSASPEKPWEKYLLPKPDTDRLKFYNSVFNRFMNLLL